MEIPGMSYIATLNLSTALCVVWESYNGGELGRLVVKWPSGEEAFGNINKVQGRRVMTGYSRHCRNPIEYSDATIESDVGDDPR